MEASSGTSTLTRDILILNFANKSQPDRLEASGSEVVLTGAIMAIIGAVSLQHGGAVASQVVRDRILARVSKN